MNFGDIPKEFTDYEKAKIVIVPVPYDGTSTWVKGADKGPQAILEASANMELYDIETDMEVYQEGIFTAKPITEKSSPDDMVNAVFDETLEHLKNHKIVVTLGGEHSVSIGSILAFNEHVENLSVLQIDAHTDLRNEYEGSTFNHACVMARVKDLGIPFVQVGIRSMDVAEKDNLNVDNVFFAQDIVEADNFWMTQVVNKLTDYVYVTIDLDGFDPSILPSTGTPEPGGLKWYQVLDLLRMVNEKTNVVGFDVVELCPNKNEKSSDFLAAKLVYKMLSYKFKKIQSF
ncbi:MAG: agmatinase [Bacteroidetes bacterium GWF2_38_335]|nr:MAG: agmatinase [Bacteroidetes bacterium GWF2_38_335]OFY80835.1 MAG: agmatinase [Bacteroidetes bacterium RIFOXYA12_FULL_38_20]HBS86237.1 agmatinase [Bacteroidales bacterium]